MLNLVGYCPEILAKGEDGGVWVQLLIFIIIGVVAVLKNFAGKGKPQNSDERPQSDREPRQQIRRRPAIAGVQNYLHEQQAAIRTAAEKYAELLKVKRREKEAKPIPQPQMMQTPILESPKTEEAEQVIDLRLDDADSLRKAIIYREIFDKPVSLR
ncbi:MAG: hypothetical protein PHF37_05965 [Phycisphaerae bacterium]|nr:hypothetical protein [Phycisphaerae bacterium]